MGTLIKWAVIIGGVAFATLIFQEWILLIGGVLLLLWLLRLGADVFWWGRDQGKW